MLQPHDIYTQLGAVVPGFCESVAITESQQVLRHPFRGVSGHRYVDQMCCYLYTNLYQKMI